MPLPALNDRKYLEKQYKDSTNLQARLSLHQRFSVNKYGWHPWIFDHFKLPSHCRILELGCGPGYLWLENISRIPAGWEILLSDFSPGMLESARQALEEQHSFEFKVIDAQAIPCEDRFFDAVIANHMLYHVPNRPAALAEIHRVLKPSGHFYASTVGNNHLVEMGELIRKFDPTLDTWEDFGKAAGSFTLENGTAQLSPWFTRIKSYHYEDALKVTEAAPLVDYLLSGREYIPRERQADFREFVAREMESCAGVIHITKDSGLFGSVRKGE
jgi:ubiquinone/menaquinone biosynthesis C-methylase UbiE